MAGIYIHIPFCKQACNYCNFYFSLGLGNKEKLIDAICKEIPLTGNFIENEKVETIYFGGGTPSLLNSADFIKILDALFNRYKISELKEFTIEANPDDLTKEKVKEFSVLKSFGLNRFSIGVQSFFDEDLQYMNRAHSASEASDSIKRVQDAGFETLTIDLIYGTPTLSNRNWEQNIQKVFELQVPHFSAYALTVEPKTPLERLIRKQQTPPVNDQQSADQFTLLINAIKAYGYEQYEISNFSFPDKNAIHNSHYWFGKKYLGLGPSAHSFDGKTRKWNVSNNLNYIKGIMTNSPIFESEILTKTQQVNEKIMTMLRTKWGLDLKAFPDDAKCEVLSQLQPIEPENYLMENGVITLTDKGKLFADSIASSLFVEDDLLL